MEFDAIIERNDRSEIRILLAALSGMILLVAVSVGIAMNDVSSFSEPVDDVAAGAAPASETVGSRSAFD